MKSGKEDYRGETPGLFTSLLHRSLRAAPTLPGAGPAEPPPTGSSGMVSSQKEPGQPPFFAERL